jgi:aminoglycoside phosphotransferase (APT) family kinase protein
MIARSASMDVREGAASDDTQRVRATEQLDWARLAAYLRDHLALAGIADLDVSRRMEVEQFPGGHSNLTYLVRFGQAELVLRRPPLGPVPPTAHDMAREHRWLAALHRVFPLAPRPYLFCDDIAVIGTIFYVMERRHGIVIRTEEPAVLVDRPDLRRRVSAALVDALADLHAIDINRHGLSSLGKPAGFVQRQVRGWTERWDRSKIADVADMEALAAWFPAHLPADPEHPSVVHGDFKLDNVMLDRSDVSRLVAVFDWEMTALGDPLVDVGILLAYWSRREPADDGDARSTVTEYPGWFSRGEIIEWYARRSGRDVSGIRFFETFALFKIAVVVQQIFSRYARGQTDDPRFAHFDRRVAHLARQAAALAESIA